MAGTGVVIQEKTICFGGFELNASALELRRGRRTVKLERVPLQVLLILIEEQGRVVTRESIANQIWGKDAFVDVDNGINTAIRKIRQWLNDDPQKPRFIETIPGMGYRFIVPLEKAEARSAESDPKVERTSTSSEIVATKSKVAAAPIEGAVASTRSFGWRFGVVVLALLCVVVVGGWLGWRRFADPPHSIQSIAVLPLQNLSGDPSEEYFSDGVTEQLITDLAKVGSLRVISRTSVMQYKGTKKALPEIGRELNVDAIVEGSVIRSGQRVRVTAQLVQAESDRHLWAETYDRDRGDILNLQGEVANAITQQIRAQLTAPQQARLRVARAVNPVAYDDYLRGRFYFDNGFSKPDSLKKAQQYFEESIQTNPSFAPAYAGLANTYAYQAFAGIVPKDQAYRSAREALTKALQLDESLGEAYDVLGVLSSDFDWNWEAADREFNRAITLAPSYSCAHEDRAAFLAVQGRRDEALAEIAKIDQLDFGIGAASSEAGVYYRLRDYPNLIDASKRALLVDPNNSHEHYQLGVGYEGTGKLQEAISEFEKAVEISSGDPTTVVMLAHAYRAVGRKAEADRILGNLERRLKGTSADSPYELATIYAGLGEKDRAFDYLTKAFRERSLELSSGLPTDPNLDSLRSDPRFRTLVSQMRLPAQ